MSSVFDVRDLNNAIKKSKALSENALRLYYEGEPNVSEATKAILENKAATERYYLEIIQLQTQIILDFEASYNHVQHRLEVEKQMIKCSFNSN